jgi:hypothetical protein
MDFFVEKILFGLLVACILALCACAGGMAASSFTAGPATLVVCTVIAVVVMGAVGAWIGYMWWDMADLGKPVIGLIIIGALAVVCTVFLPANQLINGHDIAALHREQAPRVQSFALHHFDEIAIDHTETITDGMMEQAIDHANLSAADHDLLVYMREQQSEVGHVIGSYETTTYVWISTGTNGSGYMSPITTTTYIYGINRNDLDSYPERVAELYSKW